MHAPISRYAATYQGSSWITGPRAGPNIRSVSEVTMTHTAANAQARRAGR
ncbi:hypothetical protein [Arthrobacter sp. NQ4]|nr:hypothetical protein [Arthrobacter sp. NQ4]MDE8587271.1 hypothetical protein [Arthrobacter sp. NQ4]